MKDALGNILHKAGTFRTEGVTPEEIIKAQVTGVRPREAGMTNFFEYMQKMQPEIGKEMTGPFVQSMAKYLASTKFGVSNRGFGAVLLMGEEMGTRAAVGMSQAQKQLSGQQQTVTKGKNLAALGLIKGYAKGPAWITTEVKDPALMARDLPRWVSEMSSPRTAAG